MPKCTLSINPGPSPHPNPNLRLVLQAIIILAIICAVIFGGLHESLVVLLLRHMP